MAKSILGLPESAQTTEIKDQISQLVKSVGKNAPPSVNRETVRDFIQNWPESNEFKNLFRGIYEYVKNMNMQPYTMLDIPDTIEGRETRTNQRTTGEWQCLDYRPGNPEKILKRFIEFVSKLNIKNILPKEKLVISGMAIMKFWINF